MCLDVQIFTQLSSLMLELTFGLRGPNFLIKYLFPINMTLAEIDVIFELACPNRDDYDVICNFAQSVIK